jgi:hypothetical protein
MTPQQKTILATILTPPLLFLLFSLVGIGMTTVLHLTWFSWWEMAGVGFFFSSGFMCIALVVGLFLWIIYTGWQSVFKGQ